MRRILAILKIKTLVTYRSTVSKRGSLYSLLFFAASALSGIGVWYAGKAVLNDFLSFISMSGSVHQELAAAGSIIIIILGIIISAVDMVFSHTLNMGQRTGDGEFLLSLPVDFKEFFAARVLERIFTDGLSHVFILPLFIIWGTLFNKGISGVAAALAGYCFFQLWVSTILIGISLTLHTFFPVSQVKKIVNWVSFLVTVTFLSAQMIIPGKGLFPSLTNDFLLRRWFTYIPTTWISGFMVWIRADTNLSMAYLTGAVVTTITLFFIIRAITSSFIKFGYSAGAGMKGRKQNVPATPEPLKHKKRWVKGLWWKELTLMGRDSDLMINGFLLPVTIFLISSWGIHSSMPNLRVNVNHLFMITILFLGYFHGFGAMNAAGSEGKSISLLASWFTTSFRYMLSKSLFWATAGFVVSASVYTFVCTELLRIPFRFIAPERNFLLLGMTSVIMAVTATALSALFANFEAKFLQQASSVTGKLLHFAMVLTLTGCLFTLSDGVLMHVYSVLLIGSFCLLYIAGEKLGYSSETTVYLGKTGKICGAFTGAVTISGLSCVVPVIPAIIMKDLSEAFPVALMLLGIIHLTVTGIVVDATTFPQAQTMKKRLYAFLQTIQNLLYNKHQHWFDDILQRGGALVAGVAAASIGTNIFHTSRFSQELSIASKGMSTLVIVLIFINLCLIMPLCEEILFRGLIFGELSKKRWGKEHVWPAAIFTSTLFALVHPIGALGPLFICGMVCNSIYISKGNLGLSVIAHSGYNLFVLVHHLL